METRNRESSWKLEAGTEGGRGKKAGRTRGARLERVEVGVAREAQRLAHAADVRAAAEVDHLDARDARGARRLQLPPQLFNSLGLVRVEESVDAAEVGLDALLRARGLDPVDGRRLGGGHVARRLGAPHLGL